MATNSANHVLAQIADVELSYKKTLSFVNAVGQSPRSLLVNEQFRAQAPDGGFATQITLPLFDVDLSTSPAITGSVISDCTVGAPAGPLDYNQLTDSAVVVKCNRLAYAQFKIPDSVKKTHVAGDQLQSIGLETHVYRIYNEAETVALNQAYNSGTLLLVTGSTGVDFALRTDTEANFLADMKTLASARDRQAWPQDGRSMLFVPPETYNAALTLGTKAVSSDFKGNFQVNPNSLLEGKMTVLMGFNIVEVQNLASTRAVALHPDKFVIAAPIGLQAELDLKDKDEWGDFNRMKLHYGVMPIGKTVNAYDGNAKAGQYEGILRITPS